MTQLTTPAPGPRGPGRPGPAGDAGAVPAALGTTAVPAPSTGRRTRWVRSGERPVRGYCIGATGPVVLPGLRGDR